MKTFKALTAGLLALAFATLATAQTHVYITGSTAFRKATHAAIINALGNGSSGHTVLGASIGAFSGSGFAVFTGTLAGTNTEVVFHTSWAGSTGGIQSVAQQGTPLTRSYLNELTTSPSSITLSGAVTSYTFNGGNASVTASGTTTISHTSDIAMSDTFQESSIFTGTVNLTATNTLATYESLVDNVVGIVAFRWVRGNAFTTSDGTTSVSSNFANVTNLTTLQAINLLNGGMPMSQLTGVAGDVSKAVKVFGRDEDSGTRLVTFAEPGFGVQSTPLQWEPTLGTSSLASVIVSVHAFPAVSNLLGFSFSAGHSGFSSGSSLVTALNRQMLTSANTFMIGYAGRSDALNATNGASLTYNGVDDNDTNIREGKYTFWGYEHLMYKSSLSGTALTAAEALVTQIHDVDGEVAGPLLSTMKVGRTVEGGAVTFGNPF